LQIRQVEVDLRYSDGWLSLEAIRSSLDELFALERRDCLEKEFK
jgi:hypothetical protein